MQLELMAKSGKKGNVEVSESIFGCKFNESLVHQLVTSYLAGARQGSHAQKNRSAVQGGGKKPWAQKGSGRARAGTIRSPLWRKGGVTFAAQPQDYSKRINKKMYRAAIRSILSELVRQERLMIVDSFNVDSHKTKDLIGKLKQLDLRDVLVITKEVDQNLYLAARNLPNIAICDVQAVDPVNLIKFDKVLVTVPALKQFEEMLA